MVKFSCFLAHVLPHKQKKTVQLSAEVMHETLEDASKVVIPKDIYFPREDNRPQTLEEGDTRNINAEYATDYSHTERDCRSEEIEGRYNNDSDIEVHKNSQIKKSRSLGDILIWKEENSGSGGSEDEMEQKISYDGSAGHSGVVDRDNNHHELNLSDQIQELMPSEYVQGNSEFAKDESLYSIGYPQVLEKECDERYDIHLPGVGDSDDRTPSLPSMGFSKKLSTSFMPHSRSAEDLNCFDSRKKGLMHEVGRHVQEQEGFNSIHINDKVNGDTVEDYNYVGSANDWILPVPNGVIMDEKMKGAAAFHHWDEVPSKDFRLKRIEEWVHDLQYCTSFEESNEIASFDNHELPTDYDLLDEPTTTKMDMKVNPGMEAAKRHISSLNTSATAAQLTNLGLVMIPFLGAFASLKALNISGNAIVRITVGALPRGLHILNLSRNSISTVEGLRDLARLRVLDLSYNRLLRIGHGLGGCSSIKELYLAGNKISEIEGLHRLLKLNVLDLRFNKISTTKCLGQLAANYNCLQALSLEGNPAQKNVGDEQLKKYLQSLVPHLTYYNKQSIKVGTAKDTAERSARLGISAHQIDRGLRVEVKTMRKGLAHGIVAQKVSTSTNHGRKSQAIVSHKPSRSRHGRLPPLE